jgi:hypothetical protein
MVSAFSDHYQVPDWFTGLPPAEAFNFQNVAGNHLLVSGRGVLTGWVIDSTDGAAGHTVAILDGTDANGSIIAQYRVGTNAHDITPAGYTGVIFQNGLYVVDASAFLRGTLWAITF